MRKTQDGYFVPPPEEEHDTDPDVFHGKSITVRACAGCGREIPPDDTATLRALHFATNTLHELLVKVGNPMAEELTARFAHHLGLDLL